MVTRKHTLKQSNVFLGKKIEELRLLRGMTRLELGKKLKVTIQQMDKYEAGIDTIPLSLLEKIEEACNIYLPKKYMRKIGVLRQSEDEAESEQELLQIYDILWEVR